MGKKNKEAMKKTAKKQEARIKELKRELKELRRKNAELRDEQTDLCEAIDVLMQESQDDLENTDVRFVGIVGRTRLYARECVQASLEDMLKFGFEMALYAATYGMRLPVVIIESETGLRTWLNSLEGTDDDDIDEETMLDILGFPSKTNPDILEHCDDDADTVRNDDDASDECSDSVGQKAGRILPESMVMAGSRTGEDDKPKPFFALPVWRLGESGGEAYDATIAFSQELFADLSQLWLDGEIDVEAFAHKVGVDEESAQAELEVIQTLDTLFHELSGLSLNEARVVGLHKAHPELTQAEVGDYLGTSQYMIGRTVSGLVLGWKRFSTKKKEQSARDKDADEKHVEHEAGGDAQKDEQES